MKMHSLMETDFGPLVLIWEGEPKARLTRIILPAAAEPSAPALAAGSRLISPEKVDRTITERIRGCLAGHGDAGEIDLTGLNLTDFQQRVLLACHKIPRGLVSSYGTLAAWVGCPQGARAVGIVMAANPLPLLIPCHRVVRSAGRLGDFGGGVAMKKALLVREGIELDAQSRIARRFYFPEPSPGTC